MWVNHIPFFASERIYMSNVCFVTSKHTGRTYDIYSVVRISNIQQAIFYLGKDIELLDIELRINPNTGMPFMRFLFNREDTKTAFNEWCLRKQEY